MGSVSSVYQAVDLLGHELFWGSHSSLNLALWYSAKLLWICFLHEWFQNQSEIGYSDLGIPFCLSYFSSIPPVSSVTMISPTVVFLFGEGNGNRLQYSCLENSMDRGAWRATVHGAAESDLPTCMLHLL